MNSFKSHQEMAAELGISRTTLWRRLAEHKIHVPKGLISPAKQHEIRAKLGLVEWHLT